MNDVRVAEIAARAEKATPGPWVMYPTVTRDFDNDETSWTVSQPYCGPLGSVGGCQSHPEGCDEKCGREVLRTGAEGCAEDFVSEADAYFISSARDDIEYLLSEVRRLRSVAEDAEAELVTVKQQRSDNLRAIAERDAVTAALHERLDQLTRPYGDPTFAMITERASIRELYGHEIPESVLAARDAATWDACLDAIEQNELNTDQAREGNPYRTGEGHE